MITKPIRTRAFGTLAAGLLALSVVSMPGAAFAEDRWALNLGQWSNHWDGADNETHHMIAVEYNGWMVGGLINSDDNESVIAGYHFRWPLNDWFTPGIRVGIGTSYDGGIADSGVKIGAVLSAFVHNNGKGVEFNLLPWPDGGFVSAGFRFEY